MRVWGEIFTALSRSLVLGPWSLQRSDHQTLAATLRPVALFLLILVYSVLGFTGFIFCLFLSRSALRVPLLLLGLRWLGFLA